MNAIELMVDEHRYIKRVLAVIRKFCIKIVNGSEVDYEAFYNIIDFIRNYADKHHHSKEENILFKEMIDKMDVKINRAPIQGMFAEHDLGRLFVGNLEDALGRVKNGDADSRVDIIANAIAYADLLHRHIHKEDNAIYTFARKQLSSEVMEYVEEKCREVEQEAAEKDIQRKYVNMVDELEKKV